MDIFNSSLHQYITEFSANKAIMLIMVCFMFVGGIDKIRGNKRGYGEKYDEGFQALGALAIAMIGMIALVPVIKIVLGGIIGGIFSKIGADPSLFAGIFIGMDLGGFPLAKELANTEALGYFNGMIVAAVMGINVVFNIPVGLGIIQEKDRKFLASGMLLGFATVPAACIAGGAMMILMGWDLTWKDVIMNTIPVAVFAILIIIGLVYKQNAMLKGFLAFGKGVTALVTCGTMLAVFQYLTGLRLPLFHVMVEPNAEGIVPLEEGISVIGGIAIVLIGAFPMVAFINKKFSAPIARLGTKFGMNETSMIGLIANLANNILAFQMMKDMNTKGKIMNCAFTVSAAFVLGDHLGFVANADQQMILPNIIAKFTGGITALIVANFMWKRFASAEDTADEGIYIENDKNERGNDITE
ncbi:MAG: ethanolamine utilization protein EutH [Firmicutes bacterium]|nr:ethanolamine utilization protein EutH [Bacillota bacterium]